MVSSPGGPPYSPPSPETLHAVITETLSDFPNKSAQQKVQSLVEINQLLLPLLNEEVTRHDGHTDISSNNRKLDINEDGRHELGIPSDDRAKQDQGRKASVVSQMSEKLKGALNVQGKKGGQDKEKKEKEKEILTQPAPPHPQGNNVYQEFAHKENMPFRSVHILNGASKKSGNAPFATTPFAPVADMNIIKPTSEQEVINIVKKAYADNAIVRVVGSGHSISPAIYYEEEVPHGQSRKQPARPVVLISLTKMRKITIDDSNKKDVKVTVEGGCNLGVDPENPDSNLHNSLADTLNKAGYALADLGGVSHQTVVGFAMTGSSGGTTKASFLDTVRGIRLVDGTGKLRVLTRGDSDPSEFFAAGVSMGLFGVATSITLNVKPAFFITGSQTVSSLAELNADPSKGSPIDLFGPGTMNIPSMETFLRSTEFTRCLWWPQTELNRLTVWKAGSISPINPQTGEPQTIEPYEELPQIGGSSTLAQIAARTVLIALNLFESDNAIYKKIAATLLGFFNPITEQGKPQIFTDVWFNGLPMDNEISDIILPVSFSELWFPISETQLILNDLRELFSSEFNAIGNFTTEIYAAKKSPFWLSPSFEGDVMRVNIYFFTANLRGSPEEFFARYWRWFDGRGRQYKCHWGKYLPPEFGNVVGERYRMHGEWLKVRERMDPKQIFVTPYWRSRLAIPLPASKTNLTIIMDKIKEVLASRSPGKKVQTRSIEAEDQPKKPNGLRKLSSRLTSCFR